MAVDRERGELAARLASAGEDVVARASALVDELGEHPHVACGIRLDEPTDGDLVRWLHLAALLHPRVAEDTALAALRAVERVAGGIPVGLAAADPAAVARALGDAGYPRPEPSAALLWRLSRSLPADVSLGSLPAECDGLDELAHRLARLAPGFGRAAVARFLAPLREAWPLAADLPLDDAAQQAAAHVGLLSPDMDPESAVGVLRRTLGDGQHAPRLTDLEAALGRLGRRACRRGRWRGCPLGSHCPLHPNRAHNGAPAG